MNSATHIMLVTGANRGIGLETCKQLATLGHKVILSARDETKGKAAASRLQDRNLDVVFHRLDVTEPASIETLSAFIDSEFGRLDALVNNAGVFLDSSGSSGDGASVFQTHIDLVRETMETNVYGPMRLTQALLPLMHGEGRIVNVSSGMGQLAEMNGHYPGYRLSKTALNALTRILADELKGTNIKVNSVCPGWVKTDMGGPNAQRPVEKGAETIVWLATLSQDGPSGGFFRDKQPIPW